MAISPVLFIGLIYLAGGGSLFPGVEAIWLTVPESGERCVYEEIQANVVVVLDYICIDDAFTQLGPTLDVRVTSPYGKELYKIANVTHGQAAFTTSESGTFLACLAMHHDQSHHSVNSSVIVSLDWKMGIRAKDWDSVAKKEKIEGVELEIRRSTEYASAIRANILYLRIREAYMREINEKTNTRVNQLGLMSLGVAIVVSISQVLYLKRYFLKKKLI
ncbi:Transmembrane emp24 domain-containing protein p24delta6 [Arabidopsis thaliana]|uniref:Transmembrane emp24 domain-containing protein p24delta6 n=4 Tax=Arabidopsis TaxID=3701 RepID=P24D6_ARATH|nr:emp24/gp25L/p24 family/GOLD family protein [Arabidopsis thaliana]F4J4Y0.1 RecName: Full=Transmembrane emp24 domain-containing protein p24delta6; AltName: Full=p24 family protein delta1d; Short=p24delta1d; AltName: Full=p24 family protein delta6; Short=p24delta6; Flags: Precursor [Arabidopsis thaliana]KAG7624755.1 GOLD domain [Arabidopsis thaliana x Arabidopsis arenosa]KAG7630770.1 GOLD domain [Arabidopsis suecica]AEE74954.1 emp24/gp25L/p24 family/GOLD family protein [Arabidopsis thaliana]OA|eukprot:NP_187689.2 emp24/gp25L/p24 family/GOLD family protein [Arabidopsis thaliana]